MNPVPLINDRSGQYFTLVLFPLLLAQKKNISSLRVLDNFILVTYSIIQYVGMTVVASYYLVGLVFPFLLWAVGLFA